MESQKRKNEEEFEVVKRSRGEEIDHMVGKHALGLRVQNFVDFVENNVPEFEEKTTISETESGASSYRQQALECDSDLGDTTEEESDYESGDEKEERFVEPPVPVDLSETKKEQGIMSNDELSQKEPQVLQEIAGPADRITGTVVFMTKLRATINNLEKKETFVLNIVGANQQSRKILGDYLQRELDNIDGVAWIRVYFRKAINDIVKILSDQKKKHGCHLDVDLIIQNLADAFKTVFGNEPLVESLCTSLRENLECYQNEIESTPNTLKHRKCVSVEALRDILQNCIRHFYGHSLENGLVDRQLKASLAMCGGRRAVIIVTDMEHESEYHLFGSDVKKINCEIFTSEQYLIKNTKQSVLYFLKLLGMHVQIQEICNVALENAAKMLAKKHVDIAEIDMPVFRHAGCERLYIEEKYA